MTHYLAHPEGALEFSSKDSALRYLNRARALVAGRGSRSGSDQSAPKASKDAPNITAASQDWSRPGPRV